MARLIGRRTIAHALLDGLSDADRISFATEVLTSVQDARLFLRVKLSAQAVDAHALALARRDFEREAG